jgi:hypothetical protein
VDNIRKDFGEIALGGMDWIGLAENRDLWSSFECGNEPSFPIKYWEVLE